MLQTLQEQFYYLYTHVSNDKTLIKYLPKIFLLKN
jgi:hypothetical protein